MISRADIRERRLRACLCLAHADKIAEERVRAIRATLKFGMELRADKPGMICQSKYRHLAIIGWAVADYHAMRLHAPAKLIVELVAMAVALEDNGFAIGPVGLCAGRQAADPVSQAHGTTLVGHLALRGHQIDDRVGTLGSEFGTVGSWKPQDIARELDDRNLHTQAQPQVRLARAARKVGGFDLALDAAMAEAAGNDDACHILQRLGVPLAHVLQGLGVNPLDVYIPIVIPARVTP